MARRDEIEATVNAVIFNVSPCDTGFLVKVLLIFAVNEVDNWLPAVQCHKEGVARRRKS